VAASPCIQNPSVGCHRHRVIMVELMEAADKQTGPSGL
jgi:hypothetical protein